ncbi:hypothetical protein GCM10027075_46590 [Streptomyces heilongjiangensis]
MENPVGTALPPVAVMPDGTYSFTDTPPTGGTLTCKVTYAGDTDHTPAAATEQLTVSRAATALALNKKNGNRYDHGTDVSSPRTSAPPTRTAPSRRGG